MRGDNVGALTLFSALKSGSQIAREFALDLGKAEYRPDLVQHIPGIVNKVNDCLSRRFQPGQTFHLPQCLLKARPIRPVRRDGKWWKSIVAPSSSSAIQWSLWDDLTNRERSPIRFMYRSTLIAYVHLLPPPESEKNCCPSASLHHVRSCFPFAILKPGILQFGGAFISTSN